MEEALAASVKARDGAAGRLFEAMRYSLLAGGKRLRPILTLAACEAVGGRPEQAMNFACAIEMIHTYSLIHDDLPCMDDDDLRRGRPTNHKVYGEAIATLAGDGLLTDAFKVVADGNGAPPATIVAAIAELAEAAGSAGMVGGQVIDLLGEGQTLSLQDLEVLHGKKTGALFTAAVCGGARFGGASAAQLTALREYARALGLAFQVADDLLDVEASSADIGKRTGKDEARGKATYPSLIGVDRSREFARELARRADAALAGFGDKAEALRAIAAFAVERKL
ncbi:MAG TPA: farnesyl diphosphate synthase [Candidatus Binataceae bacterium]|nr:farnesyl diphosphate synthase [Candidatus Binataceae bacterium]